MPIYNLPMNVKLEASEQLQQNKLTSKPFDGREIAVKKSFKLLPSFKRKKNI